MYNHYVHTKTYVPKDTMSIKADDVWAAAWQAYIINGKQYVKAIMPGVPNHRTNRMIVEDLLADTTKITEESREQGEIMRRYFKGLAFKVIEGKKLSPFMQSAFDSANKDEIKNKLDFAILISLPATYEKSVERDSTDRRINWARGGYMGMIGEKVSTEIEVVKRVWSQNWNTWYITGITNDDKVLFFSYKKDMNIGNRVKITGTVKGHRDASTQLNRVKVL